MSEYTNRFNIVFFEGPDCSGKTTQIKEVASRLENALVIKFPRRNIVYCDNVKKYQKKKYNVGTIVNYTTETIYNKEFMYNKVCSKNRFVRNKNFKYLLKILKLNIELNYIDKIKALRSLPDIYDKEKLPTFISSIDYTFYIKGNNNNKLTLSKIYNGLQSDNFYILFDRFHMSGNIYNKDIIKGIWTDYYQDLLPLKYTVKLFKVLKLQDEYDKLINKELSILINKNFKNSNHCETDVKDLTLTFILKDSNRLFDNMKNRKNDAYDTNGDIRKHSIISYNKNFANSTCGTSNIHLIDTDKIMNFYKNSKEFITEYIFKHIKYTFDNINKRY